MTVSVVIPTKNMANYLKFAIDSVLSQTYADWDLHIVDNGSTDSTAELVTKYSSDRRIHYWPQPTDTERAAGRNRGITESSGEYVAFLDADDLWKPDKLEKQIASLQPDSNAALCYTYARCIDPEGNLLDSDPQLTATSGDVLRQLVRGNFIPVSSVVVRRRALDTVGTFDTDRRLIGSEDWDLWLRIASRYPVRLVSEELTRYRVYNTPRSHRLILNGALAVLDKQFSRAEFPGQARITARKAKAFAYLSSAGFPLRSVAHGERLKLLLKAASISPASVASPAGLLALARLLFPFSATTALKRLMHR